MPGGGSVFIRGVERAGRLWKSWRPFTTKAKEQAERDRAAKLQGEVDDLKDELDAISEDRPFEDQG